MPEMIRVVRDATTGLHAAIVIDRTLHGVAAGGIRVRGFADERAMIDEAAALAQAMTHKARLTDVPCGGAKVVVSAGALRDRAGAMARLGEFIEALGGAIYVGSDYGFTDADAENLRRTTRYVDSRAIERELGLATARGVVHALVAALEVVRDTPRAPLAGATIAIQGLGRVGVPLSGLLRAAGAQVSGFDVDPTRVAVAGCEAVDERAMFEGRWDALAPCALGRVVDRARVTTLGCRALVGAANHQLAAPEQATAQALHDAGIVYVPDVIANAGAFIYWARRCLLDQDDRAATAAVSRIEDVTRALLADSKRRGASPWSIAMASIADR